MNTRMPGNTPPKTDKTQKVAAKKKKTATKALAQELNTAAEIEEATYDIDPTEDVENEAEIELLDAEDDDNALLADTELDFSQDDNHSTEEDIVETAALVPAGRAPSRVGDSLTLYLREISRFPMLTPEEEYDLAHKVKEGDSDAAFRLVSSHLRLVVKIAMGFQRRWMQNVLDLIQEGNVGLMRATHKFDPEKGIKFSYYAAFWVRAYILKFIMDNWRLVKIGTTQSQRKLFYNLNKERRALIAQGFDPDSAMLAERLQVPEEQIIEMEQRLEASDMSLDAPVNEEDTGGASRMDYLPALGPGIEEVLGNSEMTHMVRDRLKSLVPLLSDKEQYILEYRLLAEDPVTLREIGGKFAVTRERVRQIEARLLQKVRDHLTGNIKDFSRDWIEQ